MLKYLFSLMVLLHSPLNFTLVKTSWLKSSHRNPLNYWQKHCHYSKSDLYILVTGTVFNLGLAIRSRKPHHVIICHPPATSGETIFVLRNIIIFYLKYLYFSGKAMIENSQIVASIPARWPLHPSYMHTFGKSCQSSHWYISKKYFRNN